MWDKKKVVMLPTNEKANKGDRIKPVKKIMYSEEEVLLFLKNFNKHTLKLQSLKLGNSFNVKEWFDQFKKK